MSNLPKFTPAEVPTDVDGKVTRVAHEKVPPCAACGEINPLDAVTRTCRACWRAGPWAAAFLEARGLGSEAQEELRVLRRGYQACLDFIEAIDPELKARALGGINFVVCELPPDVAPKDGGE